ncbi:MAG TPA: cobalamin-dependent protein [Polyangiaceae bacterium]|nr:cobalamin-dependent protein [Polyangiaceae bacterium]
MRPRVLLLFPGSEGAAAGNFGVPQLVGLASYLRARAGADVNVVDLACERALGRVDFARLFEGYDVIGLSCYSSFDYLPLVALAELARSASPRAVLVAGGYHVSARPNDFIYEGSPFDVAVIGEGERPLAEVVASVAGGEPMRGRVLGPDPIDVLDDLPETDWSVLERYRGVARRVASQVEIYLSRGCPFDCAFCMEKAKREVSWRGYSVDRALAELASLHAFLGVEGWTVYFADALFGMPKAWRRAFLSKLAECNFPSLKNWLLIRVDMVDDEDLRLFQSANCSPGFGLESGDPGMLSIIRKAGRLHDYLDRMVAVSERAAELEVPWGANVIVGHPGETEESLRSSAAYMRRLFLGPARTTGFLSVDPFRYYPGSPIDDERGQYEARFGTVVHRPEWWRDGDQAFLSEWVDPSRELSYLRRDALMESEFAPILRELPQRFDYRGPSRAYFLRAVRGQIEQFSPRTRLAYLDRYYAWKKYTGQGRVALGERAADTRLAALCADARREELTRSEARHGPFEPAIREALGAVRRELHAPLDATRASVEDRPLSLDRTGAATVSALHAYARTFALAGVRPGARVLDLGAGTGYGTALLARLVGPTGYVRGVELDPQLVAAGRAALGALRNAELVADSAFSPSAWEGGPWDAVVVGFCADELPELWCAPETLGHATLVTPLRDGEGQRLFRVRRAASGELTREALDEVIYVPARREAPRPDAPGGGEPEVGKRRTRLPLA